MLLPHIYKAIHGKAGSNIKGLLSQMENEAFKNKILRLLQAYKMPGFK
jgi:hypothetical protein